MSKLFMLLISMVGMHVLSYGQNQYTLMGLVADEYKKPLAGAAVFLLPEKNGVITDSLGRFVVSNLKGGLYTIEISYVGYHTIVDTINVNGDIFYQARLKPAILTLQEVLVTDNYAEKRKREESLNIEIVNNDYLKQNMGGSLMKSLERLPGLSTIDIGAGQSKPVIRGLGFNRVVVVENNIKHESQQWGADHGLEIDQYSVDYIEVIKGPASLMYGSDAISGVIDLKNRRVPADNTFGGTLDLTGKTNNDFLGASVSVFGRKKWFFANFRATYLDYADYKVPTDSVDIYSYRAPLYRNQLRNTAGNEQNLHFSAGIIQSDFQSRLFVSHVNSKSGFFANAHGLEPRRVDTSLHDKSARDINYPYQEVQHFKVINASQYNRGKMKLEFDLGFQRNFRQEWSQYVNHGYMPAIFPDTLNFPSDLERQFDKSVFSGNLKLTYNISEKTHFSFGFSSDLQNNKIDGRGFIIPAFRQLNAGTYIFGKHAFTSRSSIQTGIRYDCGRINTGQYYDWFPSPVVTGGDTTFQFLKRANNIYRKFTNVSWSAGYVFNPEQWAIKVNIGKSFRMPIAKELAANGVNFHHFSYEVGNAGLLPEVSWQLDAGVEYGSTIFVVGITPFVSYFPNYIYLNPTPKYDRLYGAGNQVFNYTQSEVFRYGGEIHAHYQVLTSLQLGIIGEYVYSRQLSGEKKGFSLPFSPPASVIFNLKYQKTKLHHIENSYVSVDYRVAAAQTHIVPPEEITEGYQVINLSCGGDISMGNQKLSVSVQVQNLFNNKYFNHTSYYRLINVPEQGRNVVFNLTVPIQFK